jgi:hypothetical protein
MKRRWGERSDFTWRVGQKKGIDVFLAQSARKSLISRDSRKELERNRNFLKAFLQALEAD